MTMIKCGSCGNDISKKAETCPKCGHPNKQAKYLSGGQVFSYLVFALGVIWWLADGGGSAYEMKNIENKVAADAVDQYKIAKKQGDKIQICVQAGLVSAAYLQAKDQIDYQQWKHTEEEDCRQAGLIR
jgi:hypothetical protein